MKTACGCDWICNCGDTWISSHALYRLRLAGQCDGFLRAYDSADDGPEVDLIRFFRMFPEGVSVSRHCLIFDGDKPLGCYW